MFNVQINIEQNFMLLGTSMTDRSTYLVFLTTAKTNKATPSSTRFSAATCSASSCVQFREKASDAGTRWQPSGSDTTYLTDSSQIKARIILFQHFWRTQFLDFGTDFIHLIIQHFSVSLLLQRLVKIFLERRHSLVLYQVQLQLFYQI